MAYEEFQEYETERPKRRGCLLYGCLGLVAVLLLAFGGMWMIVNKIYDQFTEKNPRDLPVVEMTQEEIQDLEQRWKAFDSALELGEPTEPISLTAREINGLIQNSPGWADLKGKVFVEIDEQNQIRGDVSIPLDQLPLGDGRYFNGSATFDVSLENGVLIVTLLSAEVKGEPLPAEILESLQKQNLAKDLYQDPKAAEKLRRLESVQVKDGQITIVPRHPWKPEEGESAEEPPKKSP